MPPVVGLPDRLHLPSLQPESGALSTGSATAIPAQRKEAPECPREAFSLEDSPSLAPTSPAHCDESPPTTARGHTNPEEPAEGAASEQSLPHDGSAGEQGGLHVDSAEMSHDGGAARSPSCRSPPIPVDGQGPSDQRSDREIHSPPALVNGHGPNDQREDRDNHSLAGIDDDMQVDDLGMEYYGGLDFQCPDAVHSPSPSPSLDPNDPHDCLHENDSCAGSHDDDMQVDAIGIEQSGGRHTQHPGAGRTASPSLNNNAKDGRVTPNQGASRQDDEDMDIPCRSRALKHRRIVWTSSDDGESSDSNSSSDSHEVIDVNLYASLWEPRMVKELVSIFHSSFSALISLADKAGGTKS